MNPESISITTETKTLYEVTIRQLAEAFMHLGSDEQAEFFTHCGAIQREWVEQADGFCMPGMQWHYVRDTLKPKQYEPDNGYDFVMDLGAPFYLHTLMMRR